MAKGDRIRFAPDYAVSPGEILEETLEARGMKKIEFARRCRLSDKTVSQIISGKAPITAETAIKIERVLGVSAAIWNNLESSYRLFLAKQSARENLTPYVKLAKNFPLKELIKRRFIKNPKNDINIAAKLLEFFGVGSFSVLEHQFKQLSVNYRHSPSFKSAPESLASWLRIGEIYAEDIKTEPFNKTKFISNLKQIKKMTNSKPEKFEPKMTKLCSDAGVALVFVSELRGTHLSGATRWLTKDKALIMLSLRHKTNDHFWFSFYHEAGHILLHGKKKLFIDDTRDKTNNEEKEADDFAADKLIPYREYKKFIRKGIYTKSTIMTFAKHVGIAPGIVVGRLQHDNELPWGSKLHSLKIKFVLSEE